MSTLTQQRDREVIAERLLRASSQKSFDPEVDVDWEQQLVPDMFYMPEHRVSLYGTPLWKTMSRAQRCRPLAARDRQHGERGHLVRARPSPAPRPPRL